MSDRIIIDGVDITDLLTVKAEDVKEPVALPLGDYPIVFKSYKIVLIGEKKSAAAAYDVGIRDWPESVPESLRYVDGKPIVLTDKKLTYNMFITQDAAINVVELARNLGIVPEGRSVQELLPMFIGVPMKAEIGHFTSKRTGKVGNQVNRVYPDVG